MRNAVFVGANLTAARMQGADLTGASLNECVLSDADFRGANLTDVDFTAAYLDNVDLRECILKNCILLNAKLQFSNLSHVNLSGVNCGMADLTSANLSGANLDGALLIMANLSRVDLSHASLRGTNLDGACLNEAVLEGASLENCTVWGVYAWDLQIAGASPKSLIINRQGENGRILVDNLEIAQFVYLLLRHQKIRDVFNAITKKGVLILGRFGNGGLDLLNAVAAELKELGYIPIIFDFERPDDRSFTETIITLVGLSGFVVVDLSGPSVPQELYATVPHFKVPFVPIIERGVRPYAMHLDMLEYECVISPPVEFNGEAELRTMVSTKIVPLAEAKVKERERLRKALFDSGA